MFNSRLLLSAVVLVLSSCNRPDPVTVIPGTWAVSDVHTVMPNISPALIQEADQKELNSTYHFGKDGYFSISGPGIAGHYSGQWTYNNADSAIHLSYSRTSDTLAYLLKLHEWSVKRLELTQSYGELGYTQIVLERSE